jgi:hypothetical protein
MSTAVEIVIALFVFFAVFSILRGNVAGALAGLAGALTLGLLAAIFGGEERHDDDWRS